MLTGGGFRAALWPDHPSVEALDRVSGDRPVVLISADIHSAWLNSAALARFECVPDETGLVREDAAFAVNVAIGSEHDPLLDGGIQAAARADPDVKLVINDYDLEFAGDRYDARRAVMLDIVRQLQDVDIRVDAVGMQGHLYSHYAIDIEALARFKQELERLGVAFLVTELDVIDFQIRGGIEEQDAAATKIVSDLLDAVLQNQPPLALVAWGITDRYSWIPDVMPREDGKPARPLPLDADLRPKAWYEMLRARLAAGA